MKERRKAMLKSERARELVRKVDESELPQVEGGDGDAEMEGDSEDEEERDLEEDKPTKRMRKEDMDDADEEELEVRFITTLFCVGFID